MLCNFGRYCICQCYGGTGCLHLQGINMSHAGRTVQDAGKWRAWTRAVSKPTVNSGSKRGTGIPDSESIGTPHTKKTGEIKVKRNEWRRDTPQISQRKNCILSPPVHFFYHTNKIETMQFLRNAMHNKHFLNMECAQWDITASTHPVFHHSTTKYMWDISVNSIMSSLQSGRKANLHSPAIPWIDPVTQACGMQWMVKGCHL